MTHDLKNIKFGIEMKNVVNETKQIYAIHDQNPSEFGGAKEIQFSDALTWNKKGYGIFWTVNQFNGPRRIENLVRIHAWAIDLDHGSKNDMIERLKNGLLPSLVVETKNGFHVYWKAKDGTKENWKAIVAGRLVPFYRADPRAKDIARVLRCPGFMHLKDPLDPFLVKIVWEHDVAYSESEMLHFYDELKDRKKNLSGTQVRWREVQKPFWEFISNLNCEVALKRLSGTEYVRGEEYDFKLNGSGTKNIYVNGKSTSCWIDEKGKIGSADGGGPTVFQWLKWYHQDTKVVTEIIKKEFPECNLL